MNAESNQKQKEALDKRLDAIGWALFFIMIGGLMIVPEGSVPEGTWLIGTGVIILGMTWIRRFNGLAISWFWVFMGILALSSGLSSVFGLNIPVFPILLIIIGLSVILKPFLGKKADQTEEK
jgi:CHASE2 domain-containing sensor protein